jgi:hypothetical protein
MNPTIVLVALLVLWPFGANGQVSKEPTAVATAALESARHSFRARRVTVVFDQDSEALARAVAARLELPVASFDEMVRVCAEPVRHVCGISGADVLLQIRNIELRPAEAIVDIWITESESRHQASVSATWVRVHLEKTRGVWRERESEIMAIS